MSATATALSYAPSSRAAARHLPHPPLAHASDDLHVGAVLARSCPSSIAAEPVPQLSGSTFKVRAPPLIITAPMSTVRPRAAIRLMPLTNPDIRLTAAMLMRGSATHCTCQRLSLPHLPLLHPPCLLSHLAESTDGYGTTSSQQRPHQYEMASPINFNQFLEKEKLKSNGSNFTDWFRHVRIFLSGGNLQFVLDAPLGDPPAEDETDEVKAVYATRKTRYSQVQCAILCLESNLQKRFEHHDPHELMNELKAIFETHAAVECYEASKHFFSCMMEEGSSVSEHMLAMTGHAKKLNDLGIVIPNRLGINRVLQSLPPSYKNFVMNYNMQNMNKELPELFGMLKAAEIEIKKEHQVLMVNKTTSFKKQGKSKGKFKKGGKKAATLPMKPKNGPKRSECYSARRRDFGSVIAPSIR
ncbi:hypothetical protein QYE76_028763 [Lolium multiflorum]|uniref:Polyprotein n=1 Tax=Lolium multiflorum TaxID=4521 RepID=A0AAD8VHK5_LOLMU|nr:hypothetical protein QYE76_028763 [Lolium multiflorum]